MIHLMNVKRGAPTKRGHQHHVRFTGNRSSKVDAEEILEALRAGDQVPMDSHIDSQKETVEIVNDAVQSINMVDLESFYLSDNGNNSSAFIFQIGNASL